MKNLALSCLALMGFSFTNFAQIPLNFTAVDCNGNNKNIQQVLGTTGKTIIIMSKGVDCSICQSSAPGWQTWAAQNTSDVEVWGAITYRYNPANFNPPCSATNNWKSTYNWNDIFTFPDLNRDFVEVAMPRYYVYSPKDSSIVYSGPNSTTARNLALQESIVGITTYSIIDQIELNWSENQLNLSHLPKKIKQVKVYNLQGKELWSQIPSGANLQVNFSEFNSGLYILTFYADQKPESLKTYYIK